MESQLTTKNLKFNKDKNVGEVVIVVEGMKDEYSVLKHIFTEVLDYNYFPVRRGNKITERYQSKSNKNSNIVVINTKSSSIKSILEDENYQDRLYKIIYEEYQKSLKYVRTYFIWDRDENSECDIKKALKTFHNYHYLENYEMNGLLLISYPCLEVFELSNFEKLLYKKEFDKASSVKKYKELIKKEKLYNIENINENTLLLAVENMNRVFKEFKINKYDPSDFKENNLKILKKESDFYVNNKKWRALSLISLMLIDLGIIEKIEEN